MAEMYVYGYAITAAIQATLLARMQQGPFVAGDIEAEACRLGVPQYSPTREPVAMRAADRIIQREKRAGNLVFERPLWRWIGPDAG